MGAATLVADPPPRGLTRDTLNRNVRSGPVPEEPMVCVEVCPMSIPEEEIFRRVGEVLVDALGVEEEEVTEDATLTGDLGAESIDFLDIVFRLEKDFAIKIPKGELFPDEILNNPDNVAQDGKMSPQGLELLKKAMPHADFGDFEKDPKVAKVPDLFTVKTIVKYVRRKLEAVEAA